jgi:hypothetical protein
VVFHLIYISWEEIHLENDPNLYTISHIACVKQPSITSGRTYYTNNISNINQNDNKTVIVVTGVFTLIKLCQS